MNYLTAINYCIRMAGHAGVNDTDSSNENCAMVKDTIRRVRRDILLNGYPFNTNKITLQVDANGRVPLSKQYLKVLFPKANLSYRDDLEIEAFADQRFVWDIDANDWFGEQLDKVPVVFDIGPIQDENANEATSRFRSIPEPFASWIMKKAAADFWAQKNQGQVNPKLEQEAIRASSIAVTSVRLANINDATGWNFLRSVGDGGTFSMEPWVVLA